MLSFDTLNAMTRLYNSQIHEDYTRRVSYSNEDRRGLSTRLSSYNNETYKTNNGQYPDRPF